MANVWMVAAWPLATLPYAAPPAPAARYSLDIRAGLLALGDLQTHDSQLLRKGEPHAPHYQIVAQRIAFHATQLALRRDLGLDDGVPGEWATDVGVAR